MKQGKKVLSCHSYSHCIGAHGQCSKAIKRAYRLDRGEKKKTVFIYRHMVICVDSQKISTKKKARIISEFSKIIGYKVKIQSHWFSNASNEQLQIEMYTA